MFERTGQSCLIAFDAFQEVVRIDASLPGTIRSELESHGEAAAYIFSGSHPGLMQELFSDRKHAFVAQAAPVEIGPLPADALADLVVARFGSAGGRDPGEGLGPLLDVSEGHPQRAMLLAHHLFLRTPLATAADVLMWDQALSDARREAFGEIQVLWASCSSLERRVLKLVACRTIALQGQQAARQFGLSKGGTTRDAVDRLRRDGHLLDDPGTRTGLRITDPFPGTVRASRTARRSARRTSRSRRSA